MINIRSEIFERLSGVLVFTAKDIVLNKRLEDFMIAHTYCDLTPLLLRHYGADWGEVCLKQIKENDRSLRHGGKLKSIFKFNNTKISIITDTNFDISFVCMI